MMWVLIVLTGEQNGHYERAMVRADWYNDAPKVSEQRATTNAYFLVNLNLRQNTIILQAP